MAAVSVCVILLALVRINISTIAVLWYVQEASVKGTGALPAPGNDGSEQTVREPVGTCVALAVSEQTLKHLAMEGSAEISSQEAMVKRGRL